MTIKRVAVIGLGPAGAITVDALAQERTFDVIRVFERREEAGGCWSADNAPPPPMSDLDVLADRATVDPPVTIPPVLPAQTPKSAQPRHAESPVYPYMETNIDAGAMEFSQEPFPAEKSTWSVGVHGPDTPFRHWSVVGQYVQSLVQRHGYEDLISYGTTVERVERVERADGGSEWRLTLCKAGRKTDTWWVEYFDAVVVASGHYNVPYIPAINGLAAFEMSRPGSVVPSKHYRGREPYAGKNVVVVGASVSAADIVYDLTGVAADPVWAVVVGHTFNGYFGDGAFHHPRVRRVPSIVRVDPHSRTVHFADGTVAPRVDHIIFGTGFTWTLPFFQQSGATGAAPLPRVRNNRVPDLYLHVVFQHDPTLLFIGAVAAGLTFKIFEWQAVLASRLLAGRTAQPLPTRAEMHRWEQDRIDKRGDGPRFTLVFPDFEEYFEQVRALAGPGETARGLGRVLPPFEPGWVQGFLESHERRKRMWRRLNAEARRNIASKQTRHGLLVEAKL